MSMRFLATSAVALWMLLSTAMVQSAEWGDLRGRLVYDGNPPVPAAICGKVLAIQGLNLVDESLVVSAKGGIANIVIYVRAPGVPIHPQFEKTVPAEVRMDISQARFAPHITTLWLDKQTLAMKNLDAVGYNPKLQPVGDQGFNPLLPPGIEVQYEFNRQQMTPVPIACNIKPWLKGYVLPRNNPYSAITDAEGRFQFEKLPTGQWEFQVWHERVGYVVTEKWPKGRFTYQIKPGDNNWGTVKVKL